MDFEDRHVIGRCLDHDSPASGILLPLVIAGALPVTEDRPDAVQVKWRSGAVNQRLEYLLHLPAGGEQQVAAVLHLVDRVLVMKGAPLLLLRIQSKTETGGINAALDRKST